MNKLKKIGLTALAASLVSTSVFAGTMDVSGSAALYFTGGDKNVRGNGWSMNDSITFSGGGEMDNGWNVTATFLLDNSDGRGTSTSGQIFDNRSIAIDMDTAGTLEFWGQSGDSVVTATDDKLPNMYEEAWYGAGSPNTGAATANMFYYSNAAIVDGLNVMASYTPSGTAEVQSSTEFGATYSGVDGLTIGYATGTDGGAGATSEVDNRNMWATYAYGSVTVGYQTNSSDSKVADADTDYTGMVITYTVTDELAVSYGTAEIDYENNAFDQESTSIGASYTMGSMTLSGVHNTHDNISGSSLAREDRAVYELGLSFAF
ncbi:porin [Candidatus Pelagibacter sp.]|nr:porin [Candidatus Pelagibacter sp.]